MTERHHPAAAPRPTPTATPSPRRRVRATPTATSSGPPTASPSPPTAAYTPPDSGVDDFERPSGAPRPGAGRARAGELPRHRQRGHGRRPARGGRPLRRRGDDRRGRSPTPTSARCTRPACGARFNFVAHLGGAPDLDAFERIVTRWRRRAGTSCCTSTPRTSPRTRPARPAARAVRDRPHGPSRRHRRPRPGPFRRCSTWWPTSAAG